MNRKQNVLSKQNKLEKIEVNEWLKQESRIGPNIKYNCK